MNVNGNGDVRDGSLMELLHADDLVFCVGNHH